MIVSRIELFGFGALHIATNRTTIEEAPGRYDGQDNASPNLLRGRAFVAGLLSGQEEAQTAKLAKGAAAALADFTAVKPFWK